MGHGHGQTSLSLEANIIEMLSQPASSLWSSVAQQNITDTGTLKKCQALRLGSGAQNKGMRNPSLGDVNNYTPSPKVPKFSSTKSTPGS